MAMVNIDRWEQGIGGSSTTSSGNWAVNPWNWVLSSWSVTSSPVDFSTKTGYFPFTTTDWSLSTPIWEDHKVSYIVRPKNPTPPVNAVEFSRALHSEVEFLNSLAFILSVGSNKVVSPQVQHAGLMRISRPGLLQVKVKETSGTSTTFSASPAGSGVVEVSFSARQKISEINCLCSLEDYYRAPTGDSSSPLRGRGLLGISSRSIGTTPTWYTYTTESADLACYGIHSYQGRWLRFPTNNPQSSETEKYFRWTKDGSSWASYPNERLRWGVEPSRWRLVYDGTTDFNNTEPTVNWISPTKVSINGVEHLTIPGSRVVILRRKAGQPTVLRSLKNVSKDQVVGAWNGNSASVTVLPWDIAINADTCSCLQFNVNYNYKVIKYNEEDGGNETICSYTTGSQFSNQIYDECLYLDTGEIRYQTHRIPGVTPSKKDISDYFEVWWFVVSHGSSNASINPEGILFKGTVHKDTLNPINTTANRFYFKDGQTAIAQIYLRNKSYYESSQCGLKFIYELNCYDGWLPAGTHYWDFFLDSFTTDTRYKQIVNCRKNDSVSNNSIVAEAFAPGSTQTLTQASSQFFASKDSDGGGDFGVIQAQWKLVSKKDSAYFVYIFNPAGTYSNLGGNYFFVDVYYGQHRKSSIFSGGYQFASYTFLDFPPTLKEWYDYKVAHGESGLPQVTGMIQIYGKDYLEMLTTNTPTASISKPYSAYANRFQLNYYLYPKYTNTAPSTTKMYAGVRYYIKY